MTKTNEKKVTKNTTSPVKKTTKKPAAKKKTAKKPVAKAKVSRNANYISPDEKYSMIAMNAYFKWENTGFVHGDDHKHWLEAEQEISSMLEQK